MLAKRRIVQQRISENTFRPRTHGELMEKFAQDEQYVIRGLWNVHVLFTIHY